MDEAEAEYDRRTLISLVRRARVSLQPFADSPWPKPDHINPLGDFDGIGAHIRLSNVPIEGNTISDAAMARFVSEGEVFMDLLQTVMLNFTVIFYRKTSDAYHVHLPYRLLYSLL